MSEINKILESGILENYCLGVASREEVVMVEQYNNQYPEVSDEVDTIKNSLEKYAESYKIDPPGELKSTILGEIDGVIASEQNLKKLLASKEVDEHASPEEWIELIEGIDPPDDYEIHLHSLYSGKDKSLFVAWVRKEVPVEIHDNLYESFYILEGTCTCKIGEEYIDLKTGDYFNIPLHLEHSIKVTSSHPIKAILQRKFAA